jgi:MFS family permease
MREGNSERGSEDPAMRAAENLLWPTAIVSVVSGACAMAGFFLPVYLKSALGFTGSQIGWLCALFSLTAIIAVLPVGLRNDRTSPRLMVALSLAVASAAALAMTKVQRFAPFLVVFALYGLGLSSFRISIDALIFKTGDAKASGRRWGHLNAFRMTSMAVGVFCGGHVLLHLGFPGGLALLAGILFAGLFMTPLLLPVKAAFPKFREYICDLRQPGVIRFILWLFLFSLHWGAEMTSYGLFLRENLSLSLPAMGWYMGLEFIALAATCLWAGPRCDEGLDQNLLTAAGLLLSGFSQILMCVHPVWFSLFWRCVHGVGDGLIVVVMYSGISRLFSLRRISGHNSGVNFVMMVGSFAGSLVFGPVGEKLGYEVPLVATGVVVAALAVPILHPKRRQVPSPTSLPVAPSTLPAPVTPTREG